MARRAFLHVGTAKSGTSYLQDLWWRHHDELRERGLLLPGRARRDHFTAAALVKGMTSVVDDLGERDRGVWDRLVEETRAWPGDVLISNEHFADTPAEAGVGGARRPRLGGRRGARRRDRARPRPRAAVGLAAAGQDGRPHALPQVPRQRPARGRRPEVLALPGRPRHPRPLDRRDRPGARARRRRTRTGGAPRRALAAYGVRPRARRRRPRHRRAAAQRLARRGRGRAAAPGQRHRPPRAPLGGVLPTREGLVRARGAGRERPARLLRRARPPRRPGSRSRRRRSSPRCAPARTTSWATSTTCSPRWPTTAGLPTRSARTSCSRLPRSCSARLDLPPAALARRGPRRDRRAPAQRGMSAQ